MSGQNGYLLLAMVTIGQPVKLVEIKAGHHLIHRLAELGLTPGVELEIVQDQGGPLLLAVRNSRLALGRGMAAKIVVEAIYTR
jgi:ferrous iron transport protein A